MRIAKRAVGAGHPCYVIAEIGFNHEGDPALAERMIEAAAAAGVDAVKFQTYRADRLVLRSAPHFDLIKHGELDTKTHHRLAEVAAAKGVDFLSTPYDDDSVSILEDVGAPAFKVASMDLTNDPLLRRVAKTGKPVLLSTGMATLPEIGRALDVIADAGGRDVIVFHCISKYPTPVEEANLLAMRQIAEAFAVPVGFSDHTLGTAASIASVALGGCAIEKHFTTDKALPGPDHKISADPAEMKALVDGVRVPTGSSPLKSDAASSPRLRSRPATRSPRTR
jgi:N-acetylneuraminate synthase/N,N'-diacetyllegionaminate synthase